MCGDTEAGRVARRLDSGCGPIPDDAAPERIAGHARLLTPAVRPSLARRQQLKDAVLREARLARQGL